jgi:hypothetical protein
MKSRQIAEGTSPVSTSAGFHSEHWPHDKHLELDKYRCLRHALSPSPVSFTGGVYPFRTKYFFESALFQAAELKSASSTQLEGPQFFSSAKVWVFLSSKLRFGASQMPSCTVALSIVRLHLCPGNRFKTSRCQESLKLAKDCSYTLNISFTGSAQLG